MHKFSVIFATLLGSLMFFLFLPLSVSAFSWDKGGDDAKAIEMIDIYMNSFNLPEDIETSFDPVNEVYNLDGFGRYEEYNAELTSYHFGHPTDAMFDFYSSYDVRIMIRKLVPEKDTNNFDYGGEYDPRKDYPFMLEKNGVELYFDSEFTDPRPPSSPFGEKTAYYGTTAYVHCSPYMIQSNISATLFRDFATRENQLKTREWTFTNFTQAINASEICAGAQGSTSGKSGTDNADRPADFDSESELKARIISITPSDGEVEIADVNRNWRQASNGESLARGETLSTGFETAVVIEVTDKDGNIGRLYVREMSTFMLDYVERNGLYRTQVILNSGGIHVKERASKPLYAPFEIVTPVSTVGVRGTEFLVIVNADQSTSIEVYEGEVSVQGNSSGDYILGIAERVTVDPEGNASDPETFRVTRDKLIQDDFSGEFSIPEDSNFFTITATGAECGNSGTFNVNPVVWVGMCLIGLTVFIGIGAGMIFLFKKKKKLGLAMLLVSLVGLCLIFGLGVYAISELNSDNLCGDEIIDSEDSQLNLYTEDSEEDTQGGEVSVTPTSQRNSESNQNENSNSGEIVLSNAEFSLTIPVEGDMSVSQYYDSSTEVYTYCMRTADVNLGGFPPCAEDEVTIFSIFTLTQDEWSNWLDFYPEDTVVGESEQGYLYIFSRPNGILPDDVPTEQAFYDAIMGSFSIK